MKKLVCPMPIKWNEIHRALRRHKDKSVPSAPAPPKALILNGWSFSSDKDKAIRWQETVKWASTHGCTHLIEKLSDNDFYYANPDNDIIPGLPCDGSYLNEAVGRGSPDNVPDFIECPVCKASMPPEVESETDDNENNIVSWWVPDHEKKGS